MSVTTDPHIALALWMQFHDSAFPAGRMVHSQGLEQWLVERPGATDAEIGAAVLAYLAHSYATLDTTVTAAAWRAAPDAQALAELDELTATHKLFDNARTASESAGRQLAVAARQTGLAGVCTYLDRVVAGGTPGNCAVVEGVLQAQLGIPVRLAALGSLRSAMSSMLSAAIRLGRLGPMSGQRLQARAVPMLVDLAQQACDRAVADISSFTPALDISGMRHETTTSRLFTT